MAFKKLKYWFDKELAKMLADKILNISPTFDKLTFVNSIDKKVQSLELKGRIEIIADELANHLSNDYESNIGILRQILGPENKEETGMFINYYWIMPIAKYVEKFGLNEFEISMGIIEEITKRNTGEYTIRPFIESYQSETLEVMKNWSKNSNKHVRRLSSEGCRPRLPWAKKLNGLIENPLPIIPILNNLKDDKSKYVQKSVANCINDILKDNREIGMQIIEDWKCDNLNKERRWIIKHSLRNLLKNEDVWAKEMVK